MSKLQALAAARKKKAQEQKSGRLGVEKPMSGLSINGEGKEAITEKPVETASKLPARGFPLRKRKDSNPHEKPPKTSPPEKVPDKTNPDTPMYIVPIEEAAPSAFASIMFSSPGQPTPSTELFSLPYVVSNSTPTADPFAGPSPDDVVIAAQSKGSTLSGNAKK